VAVKKGTPHSGKDLKRDATDDGRGHLYPRDQSQKQRNNEKEGNDSTDIRAIAQGQKKITYRKAQCVAEGTKNVQTATRSLKNNILIPLFTN
jgi:hypothetical protein